MILIIGSNRDDTLYFESALSNTRREQLFNRYDVVFGSIFKQDICVVSGVFTSYDSSAAITYLLNKYFIVLVFVVGKATAYSSDLQIGDIILSRRTYLADVDQVEESNTVIGQIPSFPPYFKTQNDILEYTVKALEARTFASYKIATFVSSNIAYTHLDQISSFSVENQMFGHEQRLAFDSITGGVAVGCELYRTPFIAMKVIAREFGKRQSATNYSVVLKNYTAVGKAIITTIGDIGRNDIIRGDEQ